MHPAHPPMRMPGWQPKLRPGPPPGPLRRPDIPPQPDKLPPQPQLDMPPSGDEVPYDLTVQIDTFKDEPAHKDPETGKWRRACTFIDATIFVERAGQKTIIIGDKGSRIKQIGTDARLDMEKLFDRKIMLTLWVKVKKGWSDDERALTSLGY